MKPPAHIKVHVEGHYLKSSVAITIPLKEHLKTMAEVDHDYDAAHDLESEVETEDEDLSDEVRRICDK